MRDQELDGRLGHVRTLSHASVKGSSAVADSAESGGKRAWESASERSSGSRVNAATTPASVRRWQPVTCDCTPSSAQVFARVSKAPVHMLPAVLCAHLQPR